MSRSGRFLVKPDDVPARVPEPRGDLRSVRADRLYNLAPVGGDRLNGRRNTIDHDVNQETRLGGRRAP